MKKHFITRSFTLLELIIVIIILGILAVLAFGQYVRVIEKGRTAEAKSNLAIVRKMDLAYFQETGNHFITADLATQLSLPIAAPVCTNGLFYYGYSVDVLGVIPGAVTFRATRCTGGGKPPVGPQGADAYSIWVDVDGNSGSKPVGWW